MKKELKDILFCIVTVCTAICFFAVYLLHGHDKFHFIMGCAWVCISAPKVAAITKKAKQE